MLLDLSSKYLWLNSHSFVLDIPIAPLPVFYYSEAFQMTALILCRC